MSELETELVKFIVIYQTKKISYFLPKKDKILDLSQNNLVYQFICPGCNALYIGKTERNLATRLSAISKHLCECDYTSYLLSMNNLFDSLNVSDSDKTDTSYYSHAELILK